ncbi:MAG: DUF721 domain-containing protein [Muribaculaceae bacterium]|nr:DUF721 domain-containing protein [Muribaculaceae bacterium]
MKRTEPLRIDEIIRRMIDATGMRPEYSRRSVESMWPAVAGRNIAAYTTRLYVKDRLLHVFISSASLKEELGYVRAQLARRLNDAVGADVIDNVILH